MEGSSRSCASGGCRRRPRSAEAPATDKWRSQSRPARREFFLSREILKSPSPNSNPRRFKLIPGCFLNSPARISIDGWEKRSPANSPVNCAFASRSTARSSGWLVLGRLVCRPHERRSKKVYRQRPAHLDRLHRRPPSIAAKRRPFLTGNQMTAIAVGSTGESVDPNSWPHFFV